MYSLTFYKTHIIVINTNINNDILKIQYNTILILF